YNIILTGVTSHHGLGFNRAILFLVNSKDRCLDPKMAIGPDSLEHAQKIWNYIAERNHHLDDLIQNDSISHQKQSSLFQSVQQLQIPLNIEDENILSAVYHKGTPLHLNKNQIEKYHNDPFLKHFNTTDLVVMPLKAKNTVNGIIVADNLYTQKPISEDDLRMFTMLSNQAGLAIENSQLYEKIKYQSYTDSLTDIYNHGFFQDKLNEGLNHAVKTTQNLSLMMLDIDNFKKLNDHFGHQTGDRLLKIIASILKKYSREVDYVCRYGGEEFAIILTDTEKKQAYTIAERIRTNIESYHFEELPQNQKITVSIGLSTFPEDADNKTELIALADKAMYVAKFSGKNRTCFH
ncbi:MAG: sensor domain-containing diguanylate cyclase, partial [Candidatus Omnitrophica bacterium]|nr:sensor domain-containing diguanylate cyclase [Candidatus Omnitrophota bacterium]